MIDRSAVIAEPVPCRYLGLWKRSLLATPELRDTDTTVYWLQTPRWHADIRIPAGRPDFGQVGSIGACTPEQLQWLCRQQGFAGITRVYRQADKEVCKWQRLIDYSPPDGSLDEGAMEFAGDLLIETGMHANYLEHWHLTPGSTPGYAVLCRAGDGNQLGQPLQFILIAGHYFMRVRDRDICWPVAQPENGAASDPRHANQELLDFEISFGEVFNGECTISHSTLPWLESQSFEIRLSGSEMARVTASDGRSSIWQVIEQDSALPVIGRR